MQEHTVKQLTYDNLLDGTSRPFGYFCIALNKSFEEVKEYFLKRRKEIGDVEIVGVYVKWKGISGYEKIR